MLIVLSERRGGVVDFPFSQNPLIRSIYGMKSRKAVAFVPAEVEARVSLIRLFYGIHVRVMTRLRAFVHSDVLITSRSC
jgi:hypothetical protein